MSLLDISFSGLSLAKLNKQWKSPVDVGMKKIIDSPEKSVVPNFNLSLKFNHFLFGFWGGN